MVLGYGFEMALCGAGEAGCKRSCGGAWRRCGGGAWRARCVGGRRSGGWVHCGSSLWLRAVFERWQGEVNRLGDALAAKEKERAGLEVCMWGLGGMGKSP